MKYTDPDGREVDDFENNKGFSLSSLDLTNKEIQKDSELNKYNTPLPLVALDKISTYTSSSVGISVAKRTAAYKQAIAPVTNEYGTIIGFRNPNSVYAKECASALKNVKNLSNALLVLGIGIGVADSIYCGVSQHSWEAGLKRAGRYGIVMVASSLAGFGGSALGGPWVGAGCAIVAGKVVDKWLEGKGW